MNITSAPYTDQLRGNQDGLAGILQQAQDDAKKSYQDALDKAGMGDCGCGCQGAGTCKMNPWLLALSAVAIGSSLYFAKAR
jgi:hypothetical protein